MIQQSAVSIAKQTKKQKKSKISSPTRSLMKKRREIIENNTPTVHIEYVEICNTIKKKVREDIRKHNLDEKYEKRLRHLRLQKGQKHTQPGQKPDDGISGQTRQRDPRTR